MSLISTAEAALLLGVGPSWVRRATMRGELVASDDARGLPRYRRSDVQALAETRREAAATPLARSSRRLSALEEATLAFDAFKTARARREKPDLVKLVRTLGILPERLRALFTEFNTNLVQGEQKRANAALQAQMNASARADAEWRRSFTADMADMNERKSKRKARSASSSSMVPLKPIGSANLAKAGERRLRSFMRDSHGQKIYESDARMPSPSKGDPTPPQDPNTMAGLESLFASPKTPAQTNLLAALQSLFPKTGQPK